MRVTALVLGAIALAACSKQSEEASSNNIATNTPATAPAPNLSANAPSFDCARADGQAQELVCSDPQLARIDRELDRTYRLAEGDAALDPTARDQLKPLQRGWVKGRDDCWKADDLRRCVLDAYGQRISALRTVSAAARAEGSGISIGPVSYRCEGLEGGLAATFINSEPAIMHLAWRGLDTTLDQVESGSGARYQGRADGEEWTFWSKGRDATLSVPGKGDVTCSESAT